MMKKYIYILCLSFIGIFYGCKKTTEAPLPPVITINFPQAEQQFELPANILVEAGISATEFITSVTVSLTTKDFVVAGPAFYFYPEAKNYSLSTIYTLDDNDLETDDYYILVRAELENNFKNQYQKIHLSNNVMISSSLVILTQAPGNTINVYLQEEWGNEMYLFDISGDYSASEVSEEQNLLFVSGLVSINLNAYDLSNKSLAWKLDPIPYLPMHNFNSMYFDQYLYSSFNSQYILGFNANGAIIFDTPINDSDAPGRVYRQGDIILCDIQKKDISTTHINTYYALTGALKQQLLTSFEVVDFFELANGNTLIIANGTESGFIYEYNQSQNSIQPLKTLDELVSCAEKISGTEFILATPNLIYLYQQFQNNLLQINDSKGVSRIRFNSELNTVNTISGKELNIYLFPAMVNQKTITFSDTILNIHSLNTQLRK
ncbi:MAG: hypothetical protein K9G76_07325 [Bacteroidales bacterium]|nr:hypothetical protein [Bacteroidales bacterium]MCF8404598.1 hypothetical protein [Bacteroidales bacterium]